MTVPLRAALYLRVSTARQAAGRAAAMQGSSADQNMTPQIVQKFARTARERIRIEGGGYRRDHLCALAQRIEVAAKEVRIIGSKGNLLRTLVAASGAIPATAGVPSSVLKWRTGRDSNPRWLLHHARFPSVCLKPLGHLSSRARFAALIACFARRATAFPRPAGFYRVRRAFRGIEGWCFALWGGCCWPWRSQRSCMTGSPGGPRARCTC